MRALIATLVFPCVAAATSFQQHSGTALVFDVAGLPDGDWHEIAPQVPASRQAALEAVVTREAKKFPAGALRRAGLRAVGIFAGLASSRTDGHRPWDETLGGYRYFGLWNGRDGLMAAAYSPEQLVLTFHHELFHHLDGVSGFESDDARFAAAVAGREPYPALRFDAATLRALREASDGVVLKQAVSKYASKSAGEDQAETARHLMTHLPASLLQAAEHPEWPGSQRVLHVLREYEAADARLDTTWWTRVALGGRLPADVAASGQQAVDAILGEGERFLVRGGEGPDGVNHTLQADVQRVAEVVAQVPASERPRVAAYALGRLDAYERWLRSRWTVTRSTAQVFAAVRAALGGGGPPRNRYSDGVDEVLRDARLARGGPGVAAALHAAQRAAVRLTRPGSGGSGVVIDANGRVLTAGHVAPRVGLRLTAELPDGTRFEVRCAATDKARDLALLEPVSVQRALPFAPIASTAPASGATVVAVGQPGEWTPSGERTGYQPFHVSVGRLRGIVGDPHGKQAPLGRAKHDAWTYWGHSGSPLFDTRGQVVALHNSWDSTTAMRHAVTWEAIVDFLETLD